MKVLTMEELKKFTKLNNSRLLKTETVEVLPTSNQDPAVVYLLKNTTDGYSEFMFVDGAWERFGESLIITQVYKENNHIKIKMSNGDIIDAGEVIDATLQAQIDDIQSKYEHFFQLGCDFKTAISDAITAKDNKVVIIDPVNATRDQFVNAIGAIVAGGGSSPDLPISPIKSASIASAQTNMNNGSIVFNIDVDSTVGYYDGIEIYIGETADTSRSNGNTIVYNGKEKQPMVSIESLYPYPANTNNKVVGFSGGYCVYYYPDYSLQKELYFRVYTYRSYGDEKKYNETSILLKTDKVSNDSITLSSSTVYRRLKEYYYFTSSVTYTFDPHLVSGKCTMDLFLVGGGGNSTDYGFTTYTGGGGGGFTTNSFDILLVQRAIYAGIAGSQAATVCVYNGKTYFAFGGKPCTPNATNSSAVTQVRYGGYGGSGGGSINTTAESSTSSAFAAGNGGTNGGDGGTGYSNYFSAKGQGVSQIPFNDGAFPPYGGGGGGPDATSDEWLRPGTGGATGGGNGGSYRNTSTYITPQNGAPNTGGGAGGAAQNATYTPYRFGGSGLMILKIA